MEYFGKLLKIHLRFSHFYTGGWLIISLFVFGNFIFNVSIDVGNLFTQSVAKND